MLSHAVTGTQYIELLPSKHAGCTARVPEDTAMPGYPPHHRSGFPSSEELWYKSISSVAA